MNDKHLSITIHQVLSAAKRLKGVANCTPILTSRQANEKTKASLYFKCENFQRTGAFKFRGAYNALQCLSATQKEKGVIAFSSGNHAQAVALAAQLLHIHATIVMPTDAPSIKIAATKQYGAHIIFYDRLKENREEIAIKTAKERDLTVIPPFDHPDIIAGQGTAAMELFQETGPLDYLFVPVGGGGLIAGSAIAASHFSPKCQVIGVEPEAGNDAKQSLESKKIIKIPVPETIADGARTEAIGQHVLPILLSHVKQIVTVSDSQLLKQMHFFIERMKIVVEPTGCLGAAAVFNHLMDLHGARIGIILSGGNVELGAGWKNQV